MNKISDFIKKAVTFAFSLIFGMVGCGCATIICLVLVFILVATCPLLAIVIILMIPFVAIANWESFKKTLDLKVTVNKKEEEK